MTPTTPTPSRAGRGERGHAEGRFLRRLTMVCFVVLVVSGLAVYWIGETTPPIEDDHRPPVTGQPHKPGDKPAAAHQPARSGAGGGGCGRRA
jgi:hypothetical protein